jgi:hypothetical protein
MASPAPIGSPLTARRTLLLLLLLGLGFLVRLWTSSGIVWSAHSDLLAEHVGIKVVGREAVASEGLFPLWNPSMNAGTPAFANPQSMYLFPFDLLFFALPLGIAANLAIVLNILLAGTAMLLFCRRYFHHPAAALVCAAAYMLSPRALAMIYAGWLPKMGMYALAPLLFWAVDLLLERPGRGRIALLALVGALTLLQGDMQQFYYAAAACAAWTAVRLGSTGWTRARGPVCGLLLGALLAALLAAPALLPRLEFTALSTRTQPSHEFFLQGSPRPSELPTFLDPRIREADGGIRAGFWENNFYFGFWMTPLWVLAFCGGRRRAALLLLAVGASVFLCFDSVVLRALYDHLPGFNLFRQPSRILLIGQFAAVFLAGLGTDALLDAEDSIRRRFLFSCCALAAGAVGLLVPLGWAHPLLDAGCVLMAATGLLALVPWRSPLVLGGVVLLAPVADSALRFEPLISTEPIGAVLPRSSYHDLLDRRHNPGRVLAAGRNPALGRAALLYGTAGYYGIDLVNGVASLELRHYIEYLTILEYGTTAALPGHPAVWTDCPQVARPEMLRALDVRYIIGEPSLNLEAMGAERVWEARRTPVFVFFEGVLSIPLAVWRLPNPLGPAYFASSVRPVGTEAESLQFLVRATSALDACVLGFDGDPRGLEFSGGTASFDERGFNRYRYRVQSAGRNFLILSQVWYPGWRATLDGKPVRLYRTNHALLGCVVPPGSHELTLRMTSPPLALGLGAAAAGAAGVIALVAPLRRRRGRP